MSFALYLIGFIVLIAGLAFGANMMHVAPRWIAGCYRSHGVGYCDRSCPDASARSVKDFLSVVFVGVI